MAQFEKFCDRGAEDTEEEGEKNSKTSALSVPLRQNDFYICKTAMLEFFEEPRINVSRISLERIAKVEFTLATCQKLNILR